MDVLTCSLVQGPISHTPKKVNTSIKTVATTACAHTWASENNDRPQRNLYLSIHSHWHAYLSQGTANKATRSVYLTTQTHQCRLGWWTLGALWKHSRQLHDNYMTTTWQPTWQPTWQLIWREASLKITCLPRNEEYGIFFFQMTTWFCRKPRTEWVVM